MNKLLEKLGTPSLNQFTELSEQKRRNIFFEYLVEADGVVMDDLIELHELASVEFFMLLTQYMEPRLILEARRIFYEHNRFIVWSTWLREFLDDKLGNWPHAIPVEELVQDITVRVDRRYCNLGDLAKGLQNVLRLTKVKRITIEILDRGARDGSDLATQETIRSVSGVVKALINIFGNRLKVSKVLLSSMDFNFPYAYKPIAIENIRSYWNSPSSPTMYETGNARTCFQETMQKQIAEWTNPEFDEVYW